MIENKQITDTLTQIKIAKGILCKNSHCTTSMTQLENKTMNMHITNKEHESNIIKNQAEITSNFNNRTHSVTPLASKGNYKQKPPTSEIQSSTFIRGNRNSGVSNTTKVPNGNKIIRCLNNIKGSTIQEVPVNYEDLSLSYSPEKDKSEKVTEKINCSIKYSVRQSNCVEEFSYKEDQNKLFKDAMEDKGKSIDCFNFNKDNALFCLFDGHGGDSVSIFLQQHYPYFFKKALIKCVSIEDALKTSFIDIDKELKALDLVNVGSTGCVVYITKEKGFTVVYTANIGDTRASLLKTSTSEYRRLSYDHRATDPKERKRIINQGGIVVNGRVMGQLMLSRAFGDFELKGFGVRCEPFISRYVLTEDNKNQFIILASDGVWDMFDEKEIMKYLNSTFDTEQLVDRILSKCILKKAWDNLSCFAIKLYC